MCASCCWCRVLTNNNTGRVSAVRLDNWLTICFTQLQLSLPLCLCLPACLSLCGWSALKTGGVLTSSSYTRLTRHTTKFEELSSLAVKEAKGKECCCCCCETGWQDERTRLGCILDAVYIRWSCNVLPSRSVAAVAIRLFDQIRRCGRSMTNRVRSFSVVRGVKLMHVWTMYATHGAAVQLTSMCTNYVIISSHNTRLFTVCKWWIIIGYCS